MIKLLCTLHTQGRTSKTGESERWHHSSVRCDHGGNQSAECMDLSVLCLNAHESIMISK